MNYKQSIRTIFAMAVLTIGSAIVFAHNGIEHVMGTVTAISDTSITVETVKHTTVTVDVNTTTTYTNKDAKAFLKDLKVGERVAINAKEGKDKKLQAVSVKWGATSDMKMSPDHKM
jgi:preprotein translocase subunit YajC